MGLFCRRTLTPSLVLVRHKHWSTQAALDSVRYLLALPRRGSQDAAAAGRANIGGRKCDLATAKASLSLVRERATVSILVCITCRSPIPVQYANQRRNVVRRPLFLSHPLRRKEGGRSICALCWALRLVLIFLAAIIGPGVLDLAHRTFIDSARSECGLHRCGAPSPYYCTSRTNETNGRVLAGKERSTTYGVRRIRSQRGRKTKREGETALSTTLIRVSRLEAMHIATLGKQACAQPRCYYGPAWLHFHIVDLMPVWGLLGSLFICRLTEYFAFRAFCRFVSITTQGQEAPCRNARCCPLALCLASLSFLAWWQRQRLSRLLQCGKRTGEWAGDDPGFDFV